MSSKLKNISKWIITIIIVGVSIWLTLKGINYKALLTELSNINWLWAIIPIPIMILSHYIRALRWRTILHPIMEAKSTLNLFSAVMVGYFFNNILPRGGEFIRPYVYSKRENKSFSTLFATIILERLLDVVMLLLLFFCALIFSKNRILNAFPEGSNFSNLLYILAAGCLLICLSLYPPIMNKFLELVIKPINIKLYNKLHELFIKFKRGFDILRTPSQYFRVTIESIFIWFLYALPMYIMFFCFDFSNNISLGFIDGVLLIVISGIGVSIAPSPGGIGIFHFVVKVAVVKLYGVTDEQALAYATINHFINFAVQVILGFGFFLRERISKLPHNQELSKIVTDEV